MSKAAELANLIGNINAGGGGVNRNLVINGAMNVSQRGDVTGKTAASYGGPDRFAVGITSHGTYAMSQSSTVPSGKGFANSYKLDCTGNDTSIGSNAEVTIQHRFEGQNLQTLRKGTSEAKPITVTFYCRSNLTGTFTLEFFDNDNSRQCSKNFTISSADTWEFKSITFPADTTGAFDDDNAQSAVLVWWLAAGDDFTSGTQNTSAFASNTNANRVSSSIVNMSSSTDNEFLLTGVQLEVGQNPTEFEHEPYAVTKNKCLRYYWRQGGGAVCLGSGTYYSSTNFAMHMDLPVPMRIGPTHGAEFNSSSFIVYSNASVDYIEGIGAGRNAANESGECYAVQWDSSGGNGTQGHGAISITQSSGQYIDLDAEL